MWQNVKPKLLPGNAGGFLFINVKSPRGIHQLKYLLSFDILLSQDKCPVHSLMAEYEDSDSNTLTIDKAQYLICRYQYFPSQDYLIWEKIYSVEKQLKVSCWWMLSLLRGKTVYSENLRTSEMCIKRSVSRCYLPSAMF